MPSCIPLYRPGTDLTAKATTAVTGKTFVSVTGAIDPTVNSTIQAGTTSAAAKAFGVAATDAAIGELFPIILGGPVLPVTCGAAVTAGSEVEVGAGGKAVTLSAGEPVGIAVSTTAGADVDLYIRLY